MQKLLFILLITSTIWAQRNPWSISLNPAKPDAGQEFTFIFTIQKEKIPSQAKMPRLVGVPKGSILGVEQKDGIQRGFFQGNIAVRQYFIKMKIDDSGSHPATLVWNFQGKDNVLGQFNIPIARSLDASGLDVYLSGIPDTLYVGEQFRLGIHYNAYENLLSGPSISKVDLGLEFLGNFRQKELKWQESKNPKYRMQLSQEAYLAPLRAGELEIPSMEFSYLKQGRPQRKTVEKKMGNSYFSSTTIVNEPIESSYKTRASIIQVIPTPDQNKPIFFKDMVGEFQMSGNQEADSLANGDPLKVVMNIEGNGKPEYITKPEWSLPAIWNKGEPEIQKKSWVSNGKLKTSKTWIWYLYPTRSGSLDLGEIKFAYFNPKSKEYQVLVKKFEPVKVEGVVADFVSKKQNQVNSPNTVMKEIPRWNDLVLAEHPLQFLSTSQLVFVGGALFVIIGLFFPIVSPSWKKPGRREIQKLRKVLTNLSLLEFDNKIKLEFESAWNQYFEILWSISWSSEDHEKLRNELVEKGVSTEMIQTIFKIETLWNQHHYGENSEITLDSDEMTEWLKSIKKLLVWIQEAKNV